jgi:DNA invertase Pin-like site-specific DNA recombinase
MGVGPGAHPHAPAGRPKDEYRLAPSARNHASGSLRDNLDLSTPSGRLMFQIIAAMAEFERCLIQERVRAGLRNAKLRGKTLGRPRRIVSSDEMARLREQGASFREIAEAVGASPGTVRTRLMCG